ncbi:MAG TPA: efflux RND transporter permease subunit, partial [Burkholderiales bacterium]|nr:efflux RND transporter permease subunit [Burkholderiales bacterium]
RAFRALLRGYERTLGWALRHSLVTILILFATVCLNVYLYVIVPKGFFPQQDTGRVIGTIQADQSISFQALRQKLSDFINIARQDPAVEHVVGFTGGRQRNTGIIYIILKPIEVRRLTIDQAIARLRARLAREPGATLFMQPVQDIRVGGRASNAQWQYTLQADRLADLRVWEPRIREMLSQNPKLVDVNTDQQDKGLQSTLVIDRDTASRLGVSTMLIDQTLNDAYGQRQVSTIYAPLNQYHVVMEVAPQYWQSPDSLKSVYLSAAGGAQVPLSAVARYEPTNTPLGVNHQGQFAAATISFNLPLGVSLGEATDIINRTMAELGVPASVRGSFQGTARVFRDSLASQPWLILAALLTVYIVLGILYESYVHPITILSTLPSAGVGALLALLVCGIEFSIIALIGVVLLIGIVKKNAIMMIDFAVDVERSRGLTPREAIFQACLLRFRPIMMTTMAAMLGALPLALGSGDGSELRRPLGISIVGGLIVSQLLTLYTTPVVYLYLDRFRLWCLRLRPGASPQPQSQAVSRE